MDKFLSFLAEKRAKAVERLRKAEDDIAEIDRSERLYLASGAADQPVRSSEPQSNPLDDLLHALPPPPIERGTIKQRVTRLLDGYPNGLTSGQILTILKTNGSLPGLQRESLSPQLTRLKKDGEIALDTVTSLWTRVRKHESQGL